MQKYRKYVLPVALVMGLLLHSWCGRFSFLVPYLIFTILLLTFSAVDIRRLRVSCLDVWLMVFQITVSAVCYVALHLLGASPVVSQGVLIGVLCPVASSVAVISCMLGANRETVTAYTIIGNLMVAVAAPVFFSFVGTHQDLPFLTSFWMILKRISTVLGLPFFLALCLQLWLPKVNDVLRRYNGLSFYLWAVALFFTLGQTIDYIFLHGDGNWNNIAWLALASLLFCILQFGCGRIIGRRFGDRISGQQLLGQKNTAMGIWMANYYLVPLASVYLAFYSVYQNLFNSWQLSRLDRPIR